MLWGTAERVQSRAVATLTVAGILVALASPGAADAAVAAAWRAMYGLPITHHCMFEACTATAGFVVAIAFWSAAHLVLWPRDKRKREVNLRRFRWDGAAPVAPFEWLGLAGPRRFFGAYLPMAAYLGSIALFHLIVAKPPLPVEPPTFVRFFVEVCVGVLLYDLLFYPIHVSFHSTRFPAWWRRLHHTHHREGRGDLAVRSCSGSGSRKVLRPGGPRRRRETRRRAGLASIETIHNSYADGFLQVVINVLVQRLKVVPASLAGLGFSSLGGKAAAPGVFAAAAKFKGAAFLLASASPGCLLAKHPLSRVAHNLIVTYLLTEAHSGYDLPWMMHRLFPSWYGGARLHEAHHVHGAPHYHQFITFGNENKHHNAATQHTPASPETSFVETPLETSAERGNQQTEEDGDNPTRALA